MFCVIWGFCFKYAKCFLFPDNEKRYSHTLFTWGKYYEYFDNEDNDIKSLSNVSCLFLIKETDRNLEIW